MKYRSGIKAGTTSGTTTSQVHLQSSEGTLSGTATMTKKPRGFSFTFDGTFSTN